MILGIGMPEKHPQSLIATAALRRLQLLKKKRQAAQKPGSKCSLGEVLAGVSFDVFAVSFMPEVLVVINDDLPAR